MPGLGGAALNISRLCLLWGTTGKVQGLLRQLLNIHLKYIYIYIYTDKVTWAVQQSTKSCFIWTVWWIHLLGIVWSKGLFPITCKCILLSGVLTGGSYWCLELSTNRVRHGASSIPPTEFCQFPGKRQNSHFLPALPFIRPQCTVV